MRVTNHQFLLIACIVLHNNNELYTFT